MVKKYKYHCKKCDYLFEGNKNCSCINCGSKEVMEIGQDELMKFLNGDKISKQTIKFNNTNENSTRNFR